MSLITIKKTESSLSLISTKLTPYLTHTIREIILVSLCTTDGFPISCFSINELSNQADKFAAMSSTLSSLSDSSAKQMK